MLKVLLKKQLSEVFKSYFFDAKKNKMRSKGAIIGWFVIFFAVMIGVLGGTFTMMAVGLCEPLNQVGMGWLYFLIMSGIAILFGAFGSVFNTYSGLYLAKDNDLLLSLPIPVRTVMAARLINVYLLGAMYSGVVLLPALIVYWVVAGVTAARVICGVLLLLIVTTIVLLLSCVLGWAVAKISLKLKNKSFITVLISLVFIGAYYFFYFKASDLIQDIILNATVYGEKVKGAAYGLYLFGRIGEGDWLAVAIFTAVTAILSAALWVVMSRSFLRVATSTGAVKKARYVEKRVRERSPFGAMLGKEFARFTSSANYMLNCALGVLLLPAMGILLLIKGRELDMVFTILLTDYPGGFAVLLCAMLCLLSAMSDTAAPSVSLEGKSLWIPQSLPVSPKSVLRAKAAVQTILTVPPVLFAAVCAALVIEASPAVKLLMCVLPPVYAAFSALFGTVIGLKMPMLTWTNEMSPIKQSGAVAVALFGGWGICFALGGLYLLFGYRIGATLYLLIWTVLFAAAALLLLRWLDVRGAKAFDEL